jgi:hypothetical protein
MEKKALNNLFKGLNLTEEEENLISFSAIAKPAGISQATTISKLYSIKKTEQFVEKLIKSNKELAESNSRYSRALNILTGALVLVGIIQIVIQYLKAY